MFIVCNQSSLKECLGIVSRVVPSRPTHPILGNVLLVAKENKLTLTGFDLSIGIKSSIECKVSVEGEITLPAKLFTDIINRLPDGDIFISIEDIELENPMVEIRSSSGVFYLRGVLAEEYPELPTAQENSFDLPVTPLIEGLKGTLFASATDETKQILTGVHITAKDNILEFASTDGHRLAVVKPSLEEETIIDDFELTIPNKALKEVLNIVANKETITLFSANNQLVFATDTTQLFCRSLDGGYPNYRQLLPNKFERNFNINRKTLIESLERISVFNDNKNTLVQFLLNDNDTINVSSDAKELGNARLIIPVELVVGQIRIGFNVKYLIEGLKAMNSQNIRFSMNESEQPVIITPVSGQQMTYLVMPVRIQD
jgi:DNA polymerase III subunit beta